MKQSSYEFWAERLIGVSLIGVAIAAFWVVTEGAAAAPIATSKLMGISFTLGAIMSIASKPMRMLAPVVASLSVSVIEVADRIFNVPEPTIVTGAVVVWAALLALCGGVMLIPTASREEGSNQGVANAASKEA